MDSNSVVVVERGIELYETILRAGKVATLKTYPGAEHCFDCEITHPQSLDADVTADAENETYRFLSTYLKRR